MRAVPLLAMAPFAAFAVVSVFASNVSCTNAASSAFKCASIAAVSGFGGAPVLIAVAILSCWSGVSVSVSGELREVAALVFARLILVRVHFLPHRCVRLHGLSISAMRSSGESAW